MKYKELALQVWILLQFMNNPVQTKLLKPMREKNKNRENLELSFINIDGSPVNTGQFFSRIDTEISKYPGHNTFIDELNLPKSSVNSSPVSAMESLLTSNTSSPVVNLGPETLARGDIIDNVSGFF